MKAIFVLLASCVTVLSFNNPYCPSSITLISEYGIGSGASSNQYCINSIQRVYDLNGLLECKPFACCQCYQIQCGGYDDSNCDKLLISDSGAIGNQNIKVYGNLISAFNRNNIINNLVNGAQIICNGITSCMSSNIYGEYVGKLSCLGYMACYGANIRLINPGLNLNIECIGMMSCMNTKLEIIIIPQLMSDDQLFELDTIKFNGQESSKGMIISIINYAYLPILIRNIQCINPIACVTNLNVEIKGFFNIQNCSILLPFSACNPTDPPSIDPVLAQPIESQPIQSQPIESQPIESQPIESQPIESQPIQSQPELPAIDGNELPGVDGTDNDDADTGDLIDCALESCKNKEKTYRPDTLGEFVLECPGDACTNYKLTLTGSKISRISKLKFTEKNMNPKSTDKTVIKFESIPGQSVTIDTLNCAVRNACRNLEITAGGDIDINTVKCEKQIRCPNCFINGKECFNF